MRHLRKNRLSTGKSKTRQNPSRWMTPLRAVPRDGICEDVYPGGFRSTLAGRIYPAPKVVPFPGTVEAEMSQVERDFSAPVSLCAMLFFAPPVDYFAAFRGLKKHTGRAGNGGLINPPR